VKVLTIGGRRKHESRCSSWNRSCLLKENLVRISGWTVPCLGQGAVDLMQEETEDHRDLFTGLDSTRSGLRISSFNWPLLPVPEAVLL
jgi:hypothetical protein